MMMKKKVLFATTALALLASCTPTEEKGVATFSFFEYQGEDARFDQQIDPEKEYLNPILSGFYPDPSFCRKGEDYYMVNSTFSYYPGIPIFHSRDLVNWEQIGHVLDRPSQLQLDSIRLSGGIYAPAITYNPANDTFYLITTCVDGIGNFVVKTKDPAGDWSDPIVLPKVGGIDPALFFDDDGKAYLVHNDAPAGEPEYSGHRAIWIHDYDTNTDQTTGTPQVIIDGGVDKSKHPIWIEGPHIYKIKGKYYLMAAEGGTSEGHSEVIFTADHVKGPYTPAKENPILTQRDLPEDRPDKITCTGHADLIETASGQWFAVFLGCRPYEGNLYNTGRETFLLPVTWKGDVPVILEQGKAIPTVVRPEGWKRDVQGIKPGMLTGNFTWRDEFDENTDKLRPEWLFLRTPQGNWWKMQDGKLRITPTTRSIYMQDAASFIGYRQKNTDFTVTTEMSFVPQSETEMAGLVCYQNERFNITFTKTLLEGVPTLGVVRMEKGEFEALGIYEMSEEESKLPVYMRIVGRGGAYSFDYSFDNKVWERLAADVDTTHLSTLISEGFTGAIIGMFAEKE